LSETDDPARDKAVRLLGKTCGWLGLLPTSHVLSDGIITTSNNAVSYYGGYADVWRGKLGEREVAIKALRISYEPDHMAMLRR
jgi:hypothetical protein